MNPIRKKELPWREIEDRVVVLSPREGKVHELNPVASFLWTAADGSKSIDELSQAAAGYFETEGQEVATDVEAFFQELTELKLIEWETPSNVDSR